MAQEPPNNSSKPTPLRSGYRHGRKSCPCLQPPLRRTTPTPVRSKVSGWRSASVAGAKVQTPAKKSVGRLSGSPPKAARAAGGRRSGNRMGAGANPRPSAVPWEALPSGRAGPGKRPAGRTRCGGCRRPSLAAKPRPRRAQARPWGREAAVCALPSVRLHRAEAFLSFRAQDH